MLGNTHTRTLQAALARRKAHMSQELGPMLDRLAQAQERAYQAQVSRMTPLERAAHTRAADMTQATREG